MSLPNLYCIAQGQVLWSGGVRIPAPPSWDCSPEDETGGGSSGGDARGVVFIKPIFSLSHILGIKRPWRVAHPPVSASNYAHPRASLEQHTDPLTSTVLFMEESRWLRRVRTTRCETFPTKMDTFIPPPKKNENKTHSFWTQLIDRITIGVTTFYKRHFKKKNLLF